MTPTARSMKLLRSGGRVVFHGWVKRGQRWQVKRVAVRAGDLAPRGC
jgi:hypothetical protein